MFARKQISCEVVGYVETKARPPYGTSHIGWWPDPILNFLGPVDIAAGDLQSFWIRVRSPKDQPPGVYHGTLTVSAQNAPAQEFPLTVRVRSFALPTHSPLPVAITFGPHDYPADEKQPLQGAYRDAPEYPVNAWKKHKLAWADILADYYINYDSLYRSGPPDFEILKHLHDRGQLVTFNLGIFDAVSRSGTPVSNALAGLRTAYDQAKALGILDHAYIYGFDECKPEMFPLLEATSQTLHREFPEALLMTTSYDHSYGMDTVAKTMQAWCPLTPSFKPDQAAKARAAGRQVWWYICCGPHHPHANMFIEYPAIEARLLMGAMTARQRPRWLSLLLGQHLEFPPPDYPWPFHRLGSAQLDDLPRRRVLDLCRPGRHTRADDPAGEFSGRLGRLCLCADPRSDRSTAGGPKRLAHPSAKRMVGRSQSRAPGPARPDARHDGLLA